MGGQQFCRNILVVDLMFLRSRTGYICTGDDGARDTLGCYNRFRVESLMDAVRPQVGLTTLEGRPTYPKTSTLPSEVTCNPRKRDVA